MQLSKWSQNLNNIVEIFEILVGQVFHLEIEVDGELQFGISVGAELLEQLEKYLEE